MVASRGGLRSNKRLLLFVFHTGYASKNMVKTPNCSAAAPYPVFFGKETMFHIKKNQNTTILECTRIRLDWQILYFLIHIQVVVVAQNSFKKLVWLQIRFYAHFALQSVFGFVAQH